MSQNEPHDTAQAAASSFAGAPADPIVTAPAQTAPPIAKQSRMRKFFGEEKQADTKTIFDSLRNMGICIAMLLGLPSLYKAIDYLPDGAQGAIGCFVIGSAVALAIANLAWTLQNLKEKSSPVAKYTLVGVGSGVIIAFVVRAFLSLPGLF